MSDASTVIHQHPIAHKLQSDPKSQARWFARVRGFFSEINEPLAAMSTFDVCAIVTLVLLFLYVGTQWYLTTSTRAFCLLAIFVPTLRYKPHMWFMLFLLMSITNYYDRLIIDNHKYLMTYWVLAMTLTTLEHDVAKRDNFLNFNGRILIGLAFSFAVVAKLLSGDFLNGGFFRYTLQEDTRFVNLVRFVGGLDIHALEELKKSTSDLKSAYLLGIEIGHVHLLNSRRLSILVWFMTIWTIVIESAVAICYVWPWPNRIFDWGRRYCLWLFLFTTYAIAFVPGFAWTLTVMGLAAMPKTQARYRIVYILLVAVVLQIYQLPLVSLIRHYFF